MKRIHKTSLLLMPSLLAVCRMAGAAQPPDVVVSDSVGNTAMGTQALLNNTTGEQNTAAGGYSINLNTTGFNNTALGFLTLANNTTGNNNTAIGDGAMLYNINGSFNTATGSFALDGDSRIGTAGMYNTADGFETLTGNSGANNTAAGALALNHNQAGSNNAACGAFSLYSNESGNLNAALGDNALYFNRVGNRNAGVGHSALKNATGDNNVGVGANAGFNLTTGSNNVAIANQGVAGESGIIRVGTPGAQTATYIAGISNSKITGSAVYITPSGQLGTLASSERYKTAIADMGTGSGKLQQLRPVTFHLRNDSPGDIQYGLIAEEVVKVYPELVIRDGSGEIEGIRYEELAPMLLNEVQQQRRKMDAQERRLRQLQRQLSALQKMTTTVAAGGDGR
jgi:hypothetical protein